MLRLNLLKPHYSHTLPPFKVLALSAASLLVLAACGGDNGGTVSTSGPNSVSGPVIAASDSTETVQPLTPADTVKAEGVQTAEAGAIAPVERIAPIPTPMETFRAMAPQQGLKITPLFKEPVSDESARIKRVEDAVQGMHNNFETIMPTMVRMASMEKDMRGLINKLQVLTGDTSSSEQTLVKDNPGEAEGEPMPLTQELVDPVGAANAAAEADGTALDDFDEPAPAVMASTPVTVTKTETTTVVTTKAEPAPASPTPAAPVAAKIDGAAEVKAIRIADHADSTRIVLDMSAKAAIPPGNFQNDNKQLVLDLPQINWNAKTEAQLKNSGLVTGYLYENGKLTLNLARPAEIKGQQSLPPEGASGYRFVLDLKTRT